MATVSRIAEFAEGRRRAYLRRLWKVRRAEAELLRRESERFLTQLEPDHPRLLALKRAARGAEKLAAWAEETVGRAERCPSINPGDWMLMGRVIAGANESVDGFVVGVSDRGGKFVRQFPKVRVDDRGEFFLICRRKQLARFKQHPELFLKVADRSGKHLFSSKHQVRLDEGSVDYLDVNLTRTAKRRRTRERREKKSRGRRRF